MLNDNVLKLSVLYPECPYAERRHAECNDPECHYTRWHYAECRYYDCHGFQTWHHAKVNGSGANSSDFKCHE